MTFWEHFDAFRKALVYPLIVLVLLTVVAFLFKDPIFEILLAANSADFATYNIVPEYLQSESTKADLVTLINTELPAQFLLHMRVSFYVGLIFTLPYLIYKLFRFASPGLYDKERKYSTRVIFFTFLAFFTGIVVNYYVIFPFSLKFLASYQVNYRVLNMISINSYMSTLMTLSILMGICFELPVMSWVLSKLGLITSAFLRKYQRHALVVIFILSAIITPTSDIFTLLLVSVPIILLYGLSILITVMSERKEKSIEMSI